MATSQTLQADRELDVTRADDVLDLEVGELGIEAQFLDNTRVLSGCELGIVFRLRTSDDHLARGKYQRGSFGFPDTHDHGRETLWVVLCISRMKRDSLEVQAAVKVDSSNNVS